MLARDASDPASQEAELHLSLDNAELTSARIDLNFGDKLANRVIVALRGLVVPGPGTLTFSVHAQGREIVASTVAVKHVPATPGNEDVAAVHPAAAVALR